MNVMAVITNGQELLSSLFLCYLYIKIIKTFKVQILEETICDHSIFVLWLSGVFLLWLYVTVLL